MSDDNGNDDDDANYEVGFGKPPKSGQFPPGQSGNPKGRPKKVAEDPWEVFQKVFNHPIGVKESDGTISKITTREAYMRQLGHKSAKGDLGAIRIALQLDEKFVPVQTHYQIPEIILLEADMSGDSDN